MKNEKCLLVVKYANRNGMFISCFYHAKCAKIKPTICDVLRGIEANGLQCYCQKCRKMSPAVLHNKLKTIRTIEELSTTANNLVARIACCRIEMSSLQELVDADASMNFTNCLIVPSVRRTRSCSYDIASLATSVMYTASTVTTSAFSATTPTSCSGAMIILNAF